MNKLGKNKMKNFNLSCTSIVTTWIKLKRQSAIVGIISLSVLLAHSGSAAADEAYITNFNTGTISKVDLNTNTLVNTLRFDQAGFENYPNYVATTPDGSYAYATQIFKGTVAVIDTTTDLQVASIPVGDFPEFVAITPNGDYAYVSNRNTVDVSVIDVATQSVIATISTAGSPLGIAVTPNGESVYVALRSGSVLVIDVATQTMTDAISLGTYIGNRDRVETREAAYIVITPDGTTAYVSTQRANDIVVIDIASNSIEQIIDVAGIPTHLAITTDGSELYVLSNGLPSITKIDIASNVITGTLASEFGGNPGFMTIYGACLYHPQNFGGGSLSLLEVVPIAPGCDIAELLIGSFPSSMAIIGGSNAPPTAVAGADQNIRAGDTVNLNGSNSFDDNTSSAALVYAWSLASVPEGSTPTLTNADTAMPSFVADLPGTYTIELIVTDGGNVSSVSDFVDISTLNLAPTANAGDDRLVVIGTTVVLDGSGSIDPEADSLSFNWTITSAPMGSAATIFDSALASAGLTPDVEGQYELTLAVNDFLGAGTPDSMLIMATTAQGFAENQIFMVANVVTNLGEEQFTAKGNQQAFINDLSNLLKDLQNTNPQKATKELEKLIARTDGCSKTGSPDANGKGRDWVTDCAIQAVILSQLTEALNAISE